VFTESDRRGLNQALREKQTLTHAELAQAVVKQMGITQDHYAKQPAQYRNQFDHPLLDRAIINPILDQLESSFITLEKEPGEQEKHYQHLWGQTDPNSELEREVLKAMYERGMKLPDSAQKLIPEAKCKPDFLYQESKVAVFCDGSVHDSEEQQKKDYKQRKHLFFCGYQAVTINYNHDLSGQLADLAS